MDSVGVIYALITILAWGSWLVPSEKVRFPNAQAKTFYVALSSCALAVLVVALRGEWAALDSALAWVPVFGGLLWALGAYCAFLAVHHIGLARAFGLWAALNIIVSFFWGGVLNGQFLGSPLVILVIAFLGSVMVIAGILLILFAGESAEKGAGAPSGSKPLVGYLGALGAGVLWGTYYIPSDTIASRSDSISSSAAVLPLTVGILLGTLMMVLASRKSPRLENAQAYLRALSSGTLWAMGNFCMLLTVSAIGPGPGYTLAQLCIVVNAIWGVFYFREPPPRSRAALLTLIGVVLASIAGAVLGGLSKLESMYTIIPATK
jgi:glucose uptake protein